MTNSYDTIQKNNDLNQTSVKGYHRRINSQVMGHYATSKKVWKVLVFMTASFELEQIKIRICVSMWGKRI